MARKRGAADGKDFYHVSMAGDMGEGESNAIVSICECMYICRQKTAMNSERERETYYFIFISM